MEKIKRELNQVFWILVYFILIWFIFAIIIPFTIMPNQGFIKTEIQETENLRNFAEQFKGETKEQTLFNVFNYTTTTYTGVDERLKLAFLYHKHFYYNIEKMVNKKQFLSCHVQNNLIKTILINSGQFTKNDIKNVLVITRYFTAHQYLVVQIDENIKYKVDSFFRIIERIN